MGFETSPAEFVESLPAPVRACVAALKEIQGKHDEVYSAFRRERAELEAKYEKLYGKRLGQPRPEATAPQPLRCAL